MKDPSAAVAFEASLAGAIASNDAAETARLLIANDVNKTRIQARKPPASPLRKSGFGCRVIDVAVGSEAVDIAKYPFEFVCAVPRRETVKMALASRGSLLVLVRNRLGRLWVEQANERLDVLEVQDPSASASGSDTRLGTLGHEEPPCTMNDRPERLGRSGGQMGPAVAMGWDGQGRGAG
jgi:hypothetical protein